MWKAAFTGRSAPSESGSVAGGRRKKSSSGRAESVASSRRPAEDESVGGGERHSRSSRSAYGDDEGGSRTSAARNGGGGGALLTESAVRALDVDDEKGWEDERDTKSERRRSERRKSRGDREKERVRSRSRERREEKRQEGALGFGDGERSSKLRGQSRGVEDVGSERAIPAVGSFDQFPGQYAGAVVGPTPQHQDEAHHMMSGALPSSDAAHQFPSQNPPPHTYARPQLGPTRADSYGAAADYYQDEGQSVQHQPGHRANTPNMLHNPDAHLVAASAVANPVEDTGHGAAAHFYGGGGEVSSSSPVKPASGSSTRPSKASKQPSRTSSKPDKLGRVASGAAMTAATVAALGSAGSEGRQSQQQTSSYQQAQTSSYSTSVRPTSGAPQPRPTRHNSEPPATSLGGAYSTPPRPIAGGLDGSYQSLPTQNNRPAQGGANGDYYATPPRAGREVLNSTPYGSAQSTRPVEGGANGSYYGQPQQQARPTPGSEGKPPSRPTNSNVPLYAAGAAAAGLAAYEMNQQHQQHSSQTNSTSYYTSGGNQGPTNRPPTTPSGDLYMNNHNHGNGMGQQYHYHEHKSPMMRLKDGLLNLISAPEDVQRMEEYTEYIGVCKHCFDPRSSPYMAPRQHHYRQAGRRESAEDMRRRRRSDERLGRVGSSESLRRSGSSRVDKESRYYASSSSKTGGRTAEMVGAGFAAAGVAAGANAMFNDRKQFDDTYSIQSGHRASSAARRRSRSSSRERRRRSSHGVVNGSGREEYVTVRTKDGRVEKRKVAQRHHSGSRSRSHSPGLGESLGLTASSKARRRKRGSPEGRAYQDASSRTARRTSEAEGSGILGSFFSPSQNERKPRRRSREHRKKQRGFFTFGNGSSSSSDADIAFGEAGFSSRTSLPLRRKRSTRSTGRRSSNEHLAATVAGIGATAAALAAAQKGQRISKRTSRPELGARKEVGRTQYARHGSPTGASGEDEWEDELPSDVDDASSMDSGLAFGSQLSRLSRQQSRESASSGDGLSAWGWRWGGKDKKRRRPSEPQQPVYAQPPGASLMGPGEAGMAAGAVFDDTGRPLRLEDAAAPGPSMPQEPMQYVDPRPLSDAGSRHVSTPGSFDPPVASRPGPGPLQHPQPVTPISPAFVQGPAQLDQQPQPRRTASSPTRPSFGLQDAALIGAGALAAGSIIASQGRKATKSPSNVRFGLTEEQQRKDDRERRRERERADEERRRADRTRALKEEAERAAKEEDARQREGEVHRRRQEENRRAAEVALQRERDEAARREAEMARQRREQEDAYHRERARLADEAQKQDESRRQWEALAAEEATQNAAQERAERERQLRVQFEAERQAGIERKRREAEEQERLEQARREYGRQAETERQRRDAEEQARREYEQQESERHEKERRDVASSRRSSAGSSWGPVAAGAVAAATVGAVLAGSEHGWHRERDEQREREHDDYPEGQALYHPIQDSKPRDSYVVRTPEDAPDMSAEKIVADMDAYYKQPAPSQADFFAPKDILSQPSGGKTQVADPHGDNQVQVYHAADQDVRSHLPREGPYGPPRGRHAPYGVPALNVIEPTPPQSVAGSARGKGSRPSSPLVHAHSDDEAPVEAGAQKRDRSRSISWGEDKTYSYDPPTPDSYQERDSYMNARDPPTTSPGVSSSAPLDEVVVEATSPGSGTRTTSYHEHDLPTGAASASAEARNGVPTFDNDEVEDLGAETPPSHRRPFAEPAFEDGFGGFGVDSPGTEGAPPVRGFVEGETDEPTPAEEKVQHVPGGFDDEVDDTTTPTQEIHEPVIAEPEEMAWEPPLSKKEKKKREKAALSKRAATFDSEPSEPSTPVPAEVELPTSVSAETSIEEPADYFLSKKDKKKREKAALAQRAATFDSEPSEPSTPAPAETPSEETPQEEPEDYSTLSKKDKKKRDKALKRGMSDAPTSPIVEPEAAEDVYESPVADVTTSEADAPKLSKKEQKKRDKEAKKQGFGDVAAETVLAAGAGAAAAAASAEEPDEEWPTTGKKSKKGKKKAREAERDIRDVEPDKQTERVMSPDPEADMPGGWGEDAATPPEVPDPFQYQIQDDPAVQPEAESSWTESADTKKSKKKKNKRDSGRFNEPAASSPLRSEWNYDDYMGEQATANAEAMPMAEAGPAADSTNTNGHSRAEEKSGSESGGANGPMTAKPEPVDDERARRDVEYDDERRHDISSPRRTSPEEGRSHSVAASEPIGERESRRKSKSEKARSEVGYADDRDHYDDRSVAGSEPADLYASSKSSKRRSKREDDDTASVVSSRSRRDKEKEESPAPKKEKKGGLFGLFSRKSTESVPLSRQSTRSDDAPLSRTSTRESRNGDDDEGERKHRKKKHREGSTYGDDDDDSRSVVSESKHRHRRDRDERDEDSRERRRSSRAREDDLEDSRERRRSSRLREDEFDTRSEPGRKHRHRHTDEDDDTMSRASEGGHRHHHRRRTDDETYDSRDPSFLEMRVEDLPPLPVSRPESPALAPVYLEQDIGTPVSATPDTHTLDRDRDSVPEESSQDIIEKFPQENYTTNVEGGDASHARVIEPLASGLQLERQQLHGDTELAQLPAWPSSRPASPMALAETTSEVADEDPLGDVRGLPGSRPVSPEQFAHTTSQQNCEDEVQQLPPLPGSRPDSPAVLAQTVSQVEHDDPIKGAPVLPGSRTVSPDPFATTAVEKDRRGEETEHLPALPGSRPESPTALLETPSRPAPLGRPMSTTAIPLRFPFGHHTPQHKERSSSFSSPVASTPVSPVSAQKKPRPSSTEIRPLYLVERNRKAPEVEDTLPSLPSSKTTSRASSVQGSDDWHSAAEDFPSPRSARNLVIDTGHANSHRADDDYLDSQETTPKASEFPQTAIMRSSRDAPQFYTWEDFEQDERLHDATADSADETARPPPTAHGNVEAVVSEPGGSAPQLARDQTESLPVLPDSRPGSPYLNERPDFQSHGRSAKGVAAAAMLGSGAILAHRALKDHKDKGEERQQAEEHEPITRDVQYPNQRQVGPLPAPVDMEAIPSPGVLREEESAERPALSRQGSAKKKKKGKKGKKAAFDDTAVAELGDARTAPSESAALDPTEEAGAADVSQEAAVRHPLTPEQPTRVQPQDEQERSDPSRADTEPQQMFEEQTVRPAIDMSTQDQRSNQDYPEAAGPGTQALEQMREVEAADNSTLPGQEAPEVEDFAPIPSSKASKKAKKKQKKALAWQDLDDGPQPEDPSEEQMLSQMPAVEPPHAVAESSFVPTTRFAAGMEDEPTAGETHFDSGLREMPSTHAEDAVAATESIYPEPAVSGDGRDLAPEDSADFSPSLARKKSKKDKKKAKRQLWEDTPSDVPETSETPANVPEAIDYDQPGTQDKQATDTPETLAESPADVPLPEVDNEELESQPSPANATVSDSEDRSFEPDLASNEQPSSAQVDHSVDPYFALGDAPEDVRLPEAGLDELSGERSVPHDQDPIEPASDRESSTGRQPALQHTYIPEASAPEHISLPEVADGELDADELPSAHTAEEKDTAPSNADRVSNVAPDASVPSNATLPEAESALSRPQENLDSADSTVDAEVLDPDSLQERAARSAEPSSDTISTDHKQDDVQATSESQTETRDPATVEQTEETFWEPTSKKSKKGKKGKRSALPTTVPFKQPAEGDERRVLEEAPLQLGADTPGEGAEPADFQAEDPEAFFTPSSGKKKGKKGKKSAWPATLSSEQPAEAEAGEERNIEEAQLQLEAGTPDAPRDGVEPAASRVEEPEPFFTPSSGKKKGKKSKKMAQGTPEAIDQPLADEPDFTDADRLAAQTPTTTLPEAEQPTEEPDTFWTAPSSKKKDKKAKKAKQLSYADVDEVPTTDAGPSIAPGHDVDLTTVYEGEPVAAEAAVTNAPSVTTVPELEQVSDSNEPSTDPKPQLLEQGVDYSARAMVHRDGDDTTELPNQTSFQEEPIDDDLLEAPRELTESGELAVEIVDESAAGTHYASPATDEMAEVPGRAMSPSQHQVVQEMFGADLPEDSVPEEGARSQRAAMLDTSDNELYQPAPASPAAEQTTPLPQSEDADENWNEQPVKKKGKKGKKARFAGFEEPADESQTLPEAKSAPVAEAQNVPAEAAQVDDFSSFTSGSKKKKGKKSKRGVAEDDSFFDSPSSPAPAFEDATPLVQQAAQEPEAEGDWNVPVRGKPKKGKRSQAELDPQLGRVLEPEPEMATETPAQATLQEEGNDKSDLTEDQASTSAVPLQSTSDDAEPPSVQEAVPFEIVDQSDAAARSPAALSNLAEVEPEVFEPNIPLPKEDEPEEDWTSGKKKKKGKKGKKVASGTESPAEGTVPEERQPDSGPEVSFKAQPAGEREMELEMPPETPMRSFTPPTELTQPSSAAIDNDIGSAPLANEGMAGNDYFGTAAMGKKSKGKKGKRASRELEPPSGEPTGEDDQVDEFTPALESQPESYREGELGSDIPPAQTAEECLSEGADDFAFTTKKKKGKKGKRIMFEPEATPEQEAPADEPQAVEADPQEAWTVPSSSQKDKKAKKAKKARATEELETSSTAEERSTDWQPDEPPTESNFVPATSLDYDPIGEGPEQLQQSSSHAAMESSVEVGSGEILPLLPETPLAQPDMLPPLPASPRSHALDDDVVQRQSSPEAPAYASEDQQSPAPVSAALSQASSAVDESEEHSERSLERLDDLEQPLDITHHRDEVHSDEDSLAAVPEPTPVPYHADEYPLPGTSLEAARALNADQDAPQSPLPEEAERGDAVPAAAETDSGPVPTTGGEREAPDAEDYFTTKKSKKGKKKGKQVREAELDPWADTPAEQQARSETSRVDGHEIAGVAAGAAIGAVAMAEGDIAEPQAAEEDWTSSFPTKRSKQDKRKAKKSGFSTPLEESTPSQLEDDTVAPEVLRVPEAPRSGTPTGDDIIEALPAESPAPDGEDWPSVSSKRSKKSKKARKSAVETSLEEAATPLAPSTPVGPELDRSFDDANADTAMTPSTQERGMNANGTSPTFREAPSRPISPTGLNFAETDPENKLADAEQPTGTEEAFAGFSAKPSKKDKRKSKKTSRASTIASPENHESSQNSSHLVHAEPDYTGDAVGTSGETIESETTAESDPANRPPAVDSEPMASSAHQPPPAEEDWPAVTKRSKKDKRKTKSGLSTPVAEVQEAGSPYGVLPAGNQESANHSVPQLHTSVPWYGGYQEPLADASDNAASLPLPEDPEEDFPATAVSRDAPTYAEEEQMASPDPMDQAANLPIPDDPEESLFAPATGHDDSAIVEEQPGSKNTDSATALVHDGSKEQAVDPRPTQDIDFAATLAAGLADSGFNPNMVVDDPVFHRRSSPPGTVAEADPEEVFTTTTAKRGKKAKKGRKGQTFTEEQPVEEGVPRDAFGNTEEQPINDFDATLAQSLQGAGFDPAVLQRAISPSDGTPMNEAVDDEPIFSTTTSKRKKKGKKDRGAMLANEAVHQPSQDEASAYQTTPMQRTQSPAMEVPQSEFLPEFEGPRQDESNRFDAVYPEEAQVLRSAEAAPAEQAPPEDDSAAAILFAGDRDMDVDEMDKAYSAYKKKEKKKKKKAKTAAQGAESVQQPEDSAALSTSAEPARSLDATGISANEVPLNSRPMNEAGGDAPSIPTAERAATFSPPLTPVDGVHDSHEASLQQVSPTSKVQDMFPGPQRVKRRQPSVTSPTLAADPAARTEARPGRDGMLHTSEVTQFLPVPVEGNSSQPTSSDWSFAALEDKDLPRAVSPVLGTGEHQIPRDSGYRTANSPLLQQLPADSSTHRVPDIRTSQSRESLRSRRSAEPLHIDTDTASNWGLNVPKQRETDSDTRTAQKHSRTPSRETAETPLEPTTKNRASYLFQSPPAKPKELPGGLESITPTAEPRGTDYLRHSANREPREDARSSIGDDMERSAFSPPPAGPLSPHIPLNAIQEEHHSKRSKANSDVGGPDVIKAVRRTETPQAIRTSKENALSPPMQPKVTAPPQAFRSTPSNPLSTDHLINRLSWPAVDEDNETVNINRSLKRKPSHRIVSDQRSASVLSNRSNISAGQQLRSPEELRSFSQTSNRSSTPTLRRIDRSLSGDLRSASRRSQAGSATGSAVSARASTPRTIPFEPPPTPPSNDEDVIDDSAARAAAMSDDVFVSNSTQLRTKVADSQQQGYGDAQGSQVSPTRPPSVRKRQSMHITDLESRLDYLVAENRALQDAKQDFERTHQATSYQHDVNNQAMHDALDARDLQLQEKDAEINQIRAMLQPLQEEVARLSEFNGGLTEANRSLVDDTNGRYSTLQQEHAHAHEQWQNASRELDNMRQEHGRLTTGMRGAIESAVATALAERNAEILRLREELDIATEQIRALQVQIQSSKSSDFLTTRDEDYFDGACQKLCQHVQQWVLRFSKLSDNRICRLSTDLNDEKIEARLDNAILDGSDVDKLLGDRIRRREVFMSVVMTMVWEYVFTRYLFGMDREQRQKLKTLEKVLAEVGPPRAVAQWRATTLTLLSKRPDFARQCALDTEAVAHEIFAMLCALLPPPSSAEQQLVTSLQKVIGVAVDVSIEMRTQRAEYIMLPPLQPEYDRNGDLVRKVHFNASLMNERSGLFSSNEELERERAVVKIVLFPLVVKKGDEVGEGEEEIVVCPAQVLVHNEGGRGKKVVRVMSGAMEIDDPRRSRQSLASTTPGSAAF